MKSQSLTWALLGVLALSAFLSAGVFLFYFVPADREIRTLQNQALFINNRRMFITALANEAVEFSKTHPNIDPVLEVIGASSKQRAAAAAAAAAPKTAK